MIALTQKKRDELIFQCKCMIKSFKASEVEHPSETSLSDAILRQEIALAALTETPYGCCIVGALPNKTDSSANLYSTSTAKLMADVGYELMPLFAAPPVPEIKFPEKLNVGEIHYELTEKYGLDVSVDQLERGLAEEVYSVAVNNFKRLNGLGE